MSQKNVCQLSRTEPDWSREQLCKWWDPGRQLVLSIRRYQKWKIRSSLFSSLICRVSILQHHFWSIVAGADIPITCQLAGGLLLRHPNGIVIHPKAKIGPNCTLFQQTTVVSGVEIGGAVKIFAGAKIVRPIKIGNHAIIGANAVVLQNIPDGATAVGIPAHIVSKASQSNSEV